MRHVKLGGIMSPMEKLANVAVSAAQSAREATTRQSGTISVPNADGTRSILGVQSGNGRSMATHVGDVTPPPVPTGIRAWSGDGSLHVLWAGSLEGDVPADFDHVTVLVDGSPVAEMRSAGSVTVDGLAVGSTVSVTATAEDDACLADGTPAHNVSAASAAVSVTIRDAVAEVRADADSLATMIREDATGITVGKSADGQTWSTGRTRMTADSYQILDKLGTVITQLASDGASFLSGLVRIVAGKATLPGNEKVNSIVIDAGDGVAALSGIISRLDATINGIKSSVSAGWEQDFGRGVTAIVREGSTVASAAYLAKDKAELHVGDNHMSMTPDGFALSKPLPVSSGGTGATSIDAARRNLHISQGSKVCHGHGTPWVTLFDTWEDFQAATGCYDSGLPTLVTVNGDWSAFDGSLSSCEIKGGDAVYVIAHTTSGIPNISSTQSLRINWICIW